MNSQDIAIRHRDCRAMGKTTTKPSTTSKVGKASSSTRSSKELMIPSSETVELQDLSTLAKQMEEQLMQEFEVLLSARRKKENSGAVGNSLNAGITGNRGGKDQDARDALYWKHMYERLRDLRETDAERLLRESVQHADERERSLLDLISHLEEGGATDGARRSRSKSGKMDVRLSDVSLCEFSGRDTRSTAMEVGGQTEAKSVGPQDTRELQAQIVALQGKLSDLKRILIAYQRFTSLCISMEREASAPGGMSKLSCTAINHVHKKAVKFSLKMNVDVEDSSNMDATFRPEANKELFPPFLQQEATLETKQCPLLLLSILKTLFDEKKNGAGKE